MAQKILVIGGVALGPKAACRCKRLMPDAEITLVDENLFISYGGCGIPYYVSGEVNNLDDLRATPYHTVRDPEFFRTMKGITVRNQTRAMAIDRAAKTLLVRNVVTGEEEKLPYDKLVLATGATPRMPPVEGHDLKNVLTLTRLEAADVIRKACEHGQVNEAVIVGGGFIGLEAAVALSDMWGVKVSVVEMMDQMLPGVLSHNMGKMAAHDCEAHGLSVYTSEKVVKLEGKDGAATLLIVKVLDKDIVATAKSEKPSVDKQVQDEVGDAEKNGGEVNPEGWGESADHALFENFKFRLVATIPVNADYNDYPTYKLVFNDTMSKGITFVQIDSVKVNGIALKATDYVCTATPGQKGAGKVGENQDKPSWTLTIEDLKKVMKENTSILVTDKITVEVVYTAYLNEEAQVFNASANSTDNKNSVDLEYSNNPNADGMGKTPEDHVWLFTYVVNNTKYANTAEAGNELEGAGFTLYDQNDRVVPLWKDADGNYIVAGTTKPNDTYTDVANNEMITEANGTFNIIGLDHGTYTLKETTVPATYNPLDPVTITISADHKEAAGGASASMELTAASTMNNKLVNKSGATLPETGGIGTTIFYVLGGMMFVGAALILIVRRKAEADEI